MTTEQRNLLEKMTYETISRIRKSLVDFSNMDDEKLYKYYQILYNVDTIFGMYEENEDVKVEINFKG